MSAAAIAEALADARRAARLLGDCPPGVATVADAYAVQTALARHHGEVQGWKVSALTADQQRLYDTDKPVAGALFAPFVHDAPARLSLRQSITPLLECEIAFVLGANLPPRPTPYRHGEVEAAIAAVVPAMEIADSRVPADAPGVLKLADVMGNGAFIVGQPRHDWRQIDLGDIAIVLSHDGGTTEHGTSARILGNPLNAVVALANAQPLPAGGLRAGQIVTTGTCTTPIMTRIGTYAADYGPLGRVTLEMIA